jgi:hypothetical protein
MRWNGYIDAEEVRKAITVLQAPGKPFEIRVIGTTSRKDVVSGYFADADTLLQKFDTIDLRGRNVYITLGEVKEECFARSQSERFEKNAAATSDGEIVAYRWLFIDLDPVRATGISSSDEELEAAEELADKVHLYLQELGFCEPVRAMSGNGYHLLYRIDIKNDAKAQALVEKCLKVLSALFDTPEVKVDTTNSNPSRICKLHGTLAQKGRSTKTRPHRMSRLLSVPDQIEVTDARILLALANELPDEPEPTNNRRGGSQQNAPQEFDLPDFLARNGLTYSEDSNDRAKIYKLDHCPFDHSHTNGDAKIFWYKNGAIAFKCHHNSCRQYKWQDVRLKYEPGAYDNNHEADDERIDAGYKRHRQKQEEENAIREAVKADEPKPKPKKKSFRKLKTAEALLQKDIPEPRVFIGVGEEVPILVEGTNILSAKPKLGKSWLALGMCIAVAKGEDFLGYKTRKCSTLYLDLETSESLQQKRLRKMLKGEPPPSNFYLETETDSIENGFVDQIEDYLKQDPDIGLVVIDVFQIIRSTAKSVKETEYEHAYRDITPLNELSQKHHISIILVCHDRKAVDPDDPFSNILGSTGLQGAATQMTVMFRKRKDDPIHISVKGKTIDGLPELNVKLEDATWSIVEGVDTASREKAELLSEFNTSPIRKAVQKIADANLMWKGRCSTLLNDATELGVPITDSPKYVGGFLHRHQGRFLEEDHIKIVIVDNGTGPKIYRITKTTIDTIDENKELPLMESEKAYKQGDLEIPFI